MTTKPSFMYCDSSVLKEKTTPSIYFVVIKIYNRYKYSLNIVSYYIQESNFLNDNRRQLQIITDNRIQVTHNWNFAIKAQFYM